jgi:hypothetical protein
MNNLKGSMSKKAFDILYNVLLEDTERLIRIEYDKIINKKRMRLKIENPEEINKSSLPNLDGWSIELGNNYRDMYEFDIFQNHTIRMSLRIMREEGLDSHYDCTMVGSGRATVKYSLNKRHLKQKDSFLMIVTEIVEMMLDEQRNKQYNTTTIPPQQQWGNLPSVSAGTRITQSYNPF